MDFEKLWKELQTILENTFGREKIGSSQGINKTWYEIFIKIRESVSIHPTAPYYIALRYHTDFENITCYSSSTVSAALFQYSISNQIVEFEQVFLSQEAKLLLNLVKKHFAPNSVKFIGSL